MKRPWTEEEIKKLIQDYRAGKKVEEIANELGRSWNSVWGKIKAYNSEQKAKEKEKEAGFIRADILEDEQKLAAILSAKGYVVEKMTDDKMDRRFIITAKIEREIKIGVVSDTHLGSKYQQLSHLWEFYQRCKKAGVKVILHCGDMIDGIGVYPGQEYEIFQHGLDAQVAYAVENYPRVDGIKTYVISGNHDYSFMKKAGADPLDIIAKQREDIVYVGAYGAYPEIAGLKIYLAHGRSGLGGIGPYARSYKLQKMIEGFTPEAKPDFLFLGHYHTNCILPHYRNVFAIQMPCFQSQTPFERRNNLFPEIGGYILTLGLNDEGRKNNLALVEYEYIPFYKMKERDY